MKILIFKINNYITSLWNFVIPFKILEMQLEELKTNCKLNF